MSDPHNSTWKCLKIEGPDAADFLHRITTVPVMALSPGQGHWGFLLSPQGKIQSAFCLFKASENLFYLEHESGSTECVNKPQLALDLYHFREKLKMEEIAGIFSWQPMVAELKGSPTVEAPDSDFPIFIHREFEGFHWKSTYSATQPWPSTKVEEWNEGANSALFPRWESEWNPNYNPLETGFPEDWLPQKGCYPGQEVLEKVISIGSPARRLATVILEASSPEIATEKNLTLWREADKKIEVGILTRLVFSGKSGRGLAILKRNAQTPQTRLFGQTPAASFELIVEKTL